MILLLCFVKVQISRDCQELEPSIGEQLASLLYLEPDSELMVCLLFYFWHWECIANIRKNERN